mgnify:CR=1 FL=1
MRGKVCIGSAGKRLRRDHPRLCGEKIFEIVLVRFFPGSPPPMRGKVISTRITGVKIRITPAYAGKSSPFACRMTLTKDHPRLCGEKEVLRVEETETEGSPPPMRGKVQPLADGCMQARITPAYAGKSSKITSIFFMIKDHPRLCGEKGVLFMVENLLVGSPPPMRGKGKFSICLYRSFGITPAYAGKRIQRIEDEKVEKDHPRLCGEKCRGSCPSS